MRLIPLVLKAGASEYSTPQRRYDCTHANYPFLGFGMRALRSESLVVMRSLVRDPVSSGLANCRSVDCLGQMVYDE
jgi:hypothetical protein